MHVEIAPRVRRTVLRFFEARNYAQLSNYTKYLAQEAGVAELQYACAALDVIRGGIWYTAAENAAAETVVAETIAVDEAELAAYWARLEKHDWTYDFSDSFAVVQRGKAAEDRLVADAAGCPVKTAMFEDMLAFVGGQIGGKALPKPQFEAYLA